MPLSSHQLSLLSKGVGELKKNGHERVDVFFEPEDYHNFTIQSDRSINAISENDISKLSGSQSQREINELHLPKTFVTRKGALLLFSEDFAVRTQGTDSKSNQQADLTESIQTLEDLTKSILSFGSRREEVNLKFLYGRDTPRKIRPGYSAKRYLSRLTRNFDDSFLEKLLANGYVCEKTLFNFSSAAPSLRHRINDDLSAYPLPYRLLQQMLLAPGLLSGYTFYKSERSTISDGVIVEELDERRQVVRPSVPESQLEIMEIKDGLAKSVAYDDLDLSQKKQVLGDLLVKSVINQTLDNQRQEVVHSNLPPLGPLRESTEPLTIGHATPQEDQWTANIGQAVTNFLESNVGRPEPKVQGHPKLKGAKVSPHLVKAFDYNPFAPLPAISLEDEAYRRSKLTPIDSSPDKEYIADATVVSMKEYSSGESRSTSRQSSVTIGSSSSLAHDTHPPGFSTSSVADMDEMYIPHPPLSPILDVSREPTFNKFPTLPGIKPSNVNRQHLFDMPFGVPSGKVPIGKVRSSSVRSLNAVDEKKDLDLGLNLSGRGTPRSVQDLDYHRRLAPSNKHIRKAHSLENSLNASGLSVFCGPGSEQLSESSEAYSTRSHPSMRGKALKHFKGSSNNSSKRDLYDSSHSVKGTVVVGPDNMIIKVGESVFHDMPKTESTSPHENSPVDYRSDDEQEADQGQPAASRTGSKQTGSDDYAPGSRPRSEQQVMSALSQHAQKLAEIVLSRPGTGKDLQEDAQAMADLFNASLSSDHESVDLPPNLSSTVQSKSLVNILQDEGQVRHPSGHDEVHPVDELSIQEYEEKLRDTLASVLSQVSALSPAEIKEADITAELIESLAKSEISPQDIEVTRDEETGKLIIHTRSRAGSQASTPQRTSGQAGSQASPSQRMSGHTSQGESQHTQRGAPSEPKTMSRHSSGTSLVIDIPSAVGRDDTYESIEGSVKASDKVMLGLDIINYGEAEKAEYEKPAILVRDKKKNKGKRKPKGTSQMNQGDTASITSGKSSRSDERKVVQVEIIGTIPLPNKEESTTPTRDPLKDRDEFVVGKPKETKELKDLYAPLVEPTKPVEKKPRVPPAPKKPPKKGMKRIKKPKDESKKDDEDEVEIEPEKSAVAEETWTKPEVIKFSPRKKDEEETHESPLPTPSPVQMEEEDVEFVIVRDEFEEEEEEPPKRERSARSIQSLKSILSRGTPKVEEDLDDSDEEQKLKQISNRESRAAKRAAIASKKREETERKRKEKEEQLKRERDEALLKEQLLRELEVERKRQEEERRSKREREAEEKQRKEAEERQQEEREKREVEKEKRLKEEYQRKLEEAKARAIEEELRRKELEELRRQEEEAARIAELKMLAQMEEHDRVEYERKKMEEEAERKRLEEERRLREEEEARIAMEEARKLAEEIARQKSEYEKRLQFHRGLRVQQEGLSRTQEVSRAFVYSYFEFLQWAGLDQPEFERWKAILTKQYGMGQGGYLDRSEHNHNNTDNPQPPS